MLVMEETFLDLRTRLSNDLDLAEVSAVDSSPMISGEDSHSEVLEDPTLLSPVFSTTA